MSYLQYLYSLKLAMSEKRNISKPGPKPKLLNTSNYIFCEVDMKSHVQKYFLRDKKNGVAKCKQCNSMSSATRLCGGALPPSLVLFLV